MPLELCDNDELVDNKGVGDKDSAVSNSNKEVIDNMHQVEEVYNKEVRDDKSIDTIEEITLEE